MADYAIYTIDTISNAFVEDEAKNNKNAVVLLPIDRFMTCSFFEKYSQVTLRDRGIKESKNLICVPVPSNIDMEKVIEIFRKYHEVNNSTPKHDKGVDYTYINYKKYL